MQIQDNPDLNPLSAAQIAAFCRDLSRLVKVEVVEQTGSTNADLMARLATLNQPTLLIAETQTAGRGRAGRQWLSEAGGALTFSLAWRFSCEPQGLTGLPLAIGVAIAHCLAKLNVPVQLKWPNDVLKEGKKLAGILIESAQHHPHTWAVIGIGLNLRISKQVEQQIGREVADAMWLAKMDRNQLLALLIDELVLCLQAFSQNGLRSFVAAFNQLDAYAGKNVYIHEGGIITVQGVDCGIDEMGRLLLADSAGKITSVLAGDASLRLDGVH